MPKKRNSSKYTLADVLKVKRIFHAYRYVATRTAVLRNFFPWKYQKTDPVSSMAKVRVNWKRQLTRLKSAGWLVLGKKGQRNQLARCTPPGFTVDEPHLFCNKAHICPFCWARQHVLNPFRKFEDILYGASGPYKGPDNKLLPVIRPDLRIVRFMMVTNGSLKLNKPLVRSTMIDHWNYLQPFIKDRRRMEVTAFGAEYASVMHKVYPIPGKNMLRLTRCGIMLVPGGVSSELLSQYRAKGGIVDVYDPSKKNLSRAMYRTFSYPSSLLFENGVDLCAAMLNVMRYSRLATWYGKPANPKSTYWKAGQDGEESGSPKGS